MEHIKKQLGPTDQLIRVGHENQPDAIKVLIGPDNPVRAQMQDILSRGAGKNATIERIAELPGFSVLERPNILIDRMQGNDCVEYAFQRRLREPWNVRDLGNLERIRNETLAFLIDHGFVLVADEPKPGDLVAYGTNLLTGTPEQPEEFEHFGILGEGFVDSKLGFVFRHPLPVIPKVYGDEIIFLRRTS